MQNLIINDELKNLLPPLSDEEFAGLEASILKDGCLSPLIVWNNILVDGHYRYEICTKYGIPFSVKSIKLQNLDDAKLWAWQHQENRRNLSPYHRAEVALKLKDIIATKAKERQGKKTAPPAHTLENGPMETRQVLGEMAGVSSDTLRKVEYLVKNADEETKEKLRNGEKGTSIHREYMRLRPTEKTESLRLPLRSDKPNSEKCSPEELAHWLVKARSTAFVRELLLRILNDYRERYGKDEADAIHRYLCQTYAQ